MRILNVVKSINISQGGPPEVIRNYSSVINRKGKVIKVIKLNMISIFYFITSFINKKRYKKLKMFIQNYDIIHFHEFWSIKTLFLAYFARKLGKKLIAIPHGVLDSWSLREKYLKKKIFSILFLKKFILSLDAIFFSTKDEFFEAKKNYKLPFAFIIPNGINLEKFHRINKIQSKNKKKKIIFFGRIHKKKGIELLLNSIKSLPSEFFDDFYFEITGPGEDSYINNIQKLINDFNLSLNVFLKNPMSQNEKINYLRSGSVFILPSYEEADSIALKEAMSLNLPVIISEQCRMDIVERENAGFIVKTDTQSIKSKLLMLRDIDIENMGENSRKIIEEHFDNEICVNKLWHIYEDIHTGSHNSKAWINLNG